MGTYLRESAVKGGGGMMEWILEWLRLLNEGQGDMLLDCPPMWACGRWRGEERPTEEEGMTDEDAGSPGS